MAAAPAPDSLALLDLARAEFTLVDPRDPHLRVDDLALHRGDGIFETVLVTRRGAADHVHARDLHFTRFRASAAMLELPAPDPDLWHAALDAVVAEHRAARGDDEPFTVRYTLSRGVDAPVGWALTIPLDPKYARQRAQGIAVVTLDKGYPAYFGQSAPWMLIGAKTLSYATNQAAGRWAAAHDAEDVIYLSHDGRVLEGPSANVVIRRGGELLTPDPKAGLLHGTTQQTIFSHAAEAGLLCSYTDLTVDDLMSADGVWLTSSARTCVPVTALDGTALAHDADLSERMRTWVLEDPGTV